MIYTVTFNPSLDYVMQMEKLKPGEVNRTVSGDIYPGGKGINVSVMLSNMGRESRALGFVSGFTGEALQKMLNDVGCRTDFIRLEQGFTRINVKINDGRETEINGQGPVITGEAVRQLYDRLDKLKSDDVLVLAGSIPDTLPPDIYEKILERLNGRKIRIAVDAAGELLLNVLKYRPFLIKPNHHELGGLFGRELKTEEDITEHARLLQQKGARNVLISMAGAGAVLVTGDGRIYRSRPAKGVVRNSVGAGDSMVAGFLTGYLNTGSYEKALKLGITAGSATAFLSWLAGRKEIVELLGEEPSEYGL